MTAVEEAKMRVAERHRADDPEALIRIVMNHEEHIRRSKEKAARMRAAKSYREKHPILWRLQQHRMKRICKRIQNTGGDAVCFQSLSAATQS